MDTLRKVLAAAIVLRSLTNFAKPFVAGSAFVVLGQLRSGPWATVVAPVFGVAMLVYAWLLWTRHPTALRAGVAYAVWATLNVVLFPIVEGVPTRWAPWMYVFFAVPGIAAPWLAVWTLVARPGPAVAQRPV